MKKNGWRFVIMFLLIGTWSIVLAQSIEITTIDGGSVITELGYGIKVNKNSSLHRSWIVLNDPSCPAQLMNAGINAQYADRQYSFVPAGFCKASAAISAFEVRYLLFDVFGSHIKTLSGLEVADLAANSVIQLKETGEFRAWENEISKLLTVVVFIAQVRTADGKIWRYQEKPISEELNKIRFNVTTGILDPTKEIK